MMDGHALMCVFKARARQVQMWNVWKGKQEHGWFSGTSNKNEAHVFQRQTIGDGAVVGLLQAGPAWAPSAQMLTRGCVSDCKARLLPDAQKASASPAFMLENLKTKLSDPAPAVAAAAAAAALERAGLLLDVHAFDADVPIEVEESVFLRAHPVGEVDDGAVGQLHQEFCRGELDEKLEWEEGGAGRGGGVRTWWHRGWQMHDAAETGLTLNSSPWRKGKPPSRTSSHQLPPW